MVSSSWLPVALSSSGMSAIGTKQTWASALHMSAFGGKADIESLPITVFIGWYGLQIRLMGAEIILFKVCTSL